MANEFIHKAVGGTYTQAEVEALDRHEFNSQATGDLMYASSATQLSRLGIGTTGYPLLVVGGIPQWGGDINLAANKLKTTTLYLYEVSATNLSINKISDDSRMNLTLQDLAPFGDILFQTDAKSISAPNGNGLYTIGRARDTGVGLVEIFRMVGAADPEFQLGNNGNALRSSYSGKIGFYTKAPIAQPTGYAIPTDLATCISSLTTLRTALNNLGLQTVV